MSDEKIIELEKQLLTLDMQRREVSARLREMRSASESVASRVPATPDAKIALFRSLFRGREDVYARWWENPKTGGSGFAPAKDFFGNYQKMTDATIKNHLQGINPNEKPIGGRSKDFIAGVYPMLRNESAWLLAVDFDRDDWKTAARHFVQTARFAGIPAYAEISRGGAGMHVWFFFSQPIDARLARQMGIVLLSRAMNAHPEIGFASYDRMFPSQDNLPRGGFGNFIALPLQQSARANGATVFVDENFDPYPDQWEFLANIEKITFAQLSEFLVKNAPVPTEEESEPWLIPRPEKFTDVRLPREIRIILSNQIYIERDGIPAKVVNRIIKFAAFKNPEFYRAQAMRFSTYDKPRIISCSDLTAKYIAMPRGTYAEVREFLESCGVKIDLDDKRVAGDLIAAKFVGALRPDQEKVVKKIISEDCGIMAAPTAFGKTVTAIGVIAARKTNTLILVHRAQLATQWKERLNQFLDIGGAKIGIIGGGKNTSGGVVDIALIQSLSKREDLAEFMSGYGQLIVDECHHTAAFSFEQVAKAFRGKYILGLTATIERKDGHQPIIMMQCGRVIANVLSHTVKKDFEKFLVPRYTFFNYMNPMTGPDDVAIHDIYAAMTENKQRNQMICDDVATALSKRRACIVLSERKEHLNVFENYFKGRTDNMVVMTGGMTAKERAATMKKLKSIPHEQELLILATGAFLGEGFDEARLDTLFLTMPISWKGTLAQYAGRLNRDFDSKESVLIYDYIDDKIPMMSAMYRRRLAGYRALGFREADAEKILA
ncbi:MAG: DEAD/DEAH box helicase [Rickettsiales bacterium]|nr:DEAD/DEAH box helicase [Rickettsiales bacterium]